MTLLMMVASRKHHLEIVNVIDMASGGYKPGMITDPIKQIISDLEDNNKKSYKDSQADSQYSVSPSTNSGIRGFKSRYSQFDNWAFQE